MPRKIFGEAKRANMNHVIMVWLIFNQLVLLVRLRKLRKLTKED